MARSIKQLVVLALGISCLSALGLTACGSSDDSSAGSAGSAGEAGSPSEAGSPGEAGSSEGGASAAGAGGEAGVAGEGQMFAKLGIDTTQTPRTYVDANSNTQTLGDSYNPLGSGVKSLHPISEIYVAGRSLAGSTQNQFLLDDLSNSPTPTALPLADPADSWAANQFTHSIAADLDGDGVDEIINVYYIESSQELHANVIRCASDCAGNGGNFKNVKDSVLTVTDSTKVPLGRDWFAHGIATADVDGDGTQELVIGNFGAVDVCAAAADFSFTCKSQVTNASQQMSIARGHFESDPLKTNDDVVVAWADTTLAYVSIYDGSPNAFSANAHTSATSDPTPLSIKFVDRDSPSSYAQAYVATGDIDGDGLDEIVLAAGEAGTSPMEFDLVLMDDARYSYRFFKAFRLQLGPVGGEPCLGICIGGADNTRNNLFHPALTVFTKRTQPALEKAIYAGSYIIDDLAANLLDPDATSLPSGTDITNGVTMTDMGFYEDGGGGYNHAPVEVVAGDIDNSGQDSIVAFWDEANENPPNKNGFLPATLAKVSWDAGTGKWPRWTDFVTTTGGNAPVTGDYDSTYGTGLALPNVDRDSAIVQYNGQHELLFGTPRVLAVLAAAPYFDGLNAANSQTSISFGKGTGTDAQSTIGVRTSTSIGYEAPSLFGTTTLSWKLTFGAALDSISSGSVELTQTQTWTAGNEDAVVFQVTPFDVYYYTVVSSPDPADFNQPMSINVPRSISTYKVPVALYNSSIVDGPQIGPDAITHTVGDPTTYPSKNACASAPAGGSYGSTTFLVDGETWCFASDSTLHVGVGTGSVGFNIASTSTSTQGASTDISVDFETDAGVGGFTVGQSVGFHWGYQYTVDTSQSYSFSGQVGDLPNANHGYDFGLMAHRGQLGGVNTDYPIFLVDYWVENVQ